MLRLLPESYLQHVYCRPLQPMLQFWDQVSHQLALLDKFILRRSQGVEKSFLLTLHLLHHPHLLTLHDSLQSFKLCLDTPFLILHLFLQEWERERGALSIRQRLGARKRTIVFGKFSLGNEREAKEPFLGKVTFPIIFSSSHSKIMASSLHYWDQPWAQIGSLGMALLSQAVQDNQVSLLYSWPPSPDPWLKVEQCRQNHESLLSSPRRVKDAQSQEECNPGFTNHPLCEYLPLNVCVHL